MISNTKHIAIAIALMSSILMCTSANAAKIKDLNCNDSKPIKQGIFNNVYINEGATCIITGSNKTVEITGDVIGRGAKNISIGTPDNGEPGSVIISGKVDIQGTTEQLRINGGVEVAGDVHLLNNDSLDSVIVVKQNNLLSDLIISHNELPRIVIDGSNVGGDFVVNNNTLSGDYTGDPANTGDGLFIINPNVTGNAKVEKNYIFEEQVGDDGVGLLYITFGANIGGSFEVNHNHVEKGLIELAAFTPLEVKGDYNFTYNSSDVIILHFPSLPEFGFVANNIVVKGDANVSENFLTNRIPFGVGVEGIYVGFGQINGNLNISKNSVQAREFPITLRDTQVDGTVTCGKNKPELTIINVVASGTIMCEGF